MVKSSVVNTIVTIVRMNQHTLEIIIKLNKEVICTKNLRSKSEPTVSGFESNVKQNGYCWQWPGGGQVGNVVEGGTFTEYP